MHDLDPGSPDFPADVVNGLPDHPTAELEFDIVRTEQPSGASEPADEIIIPGAGRRYERAAPADAPADGVERLGSLSTANEVQVEQPDPVAEAGQDGASPASPDYSETPSAVIYQQAMKPNPRPQAVTQAADSLLLTKLLPDRPNRAMKATAKSLNTRMKPIMKSELLPR